MSTDQAITGGDAVTSDAGISGDAVTGGARMAGAGMGGDAVTGGAGMAGAGMGGDAVTSSNAGTGSNVAGGDAASGSDGLTLRIGPPAHGGYCVARHDGMVVFVRGTLPGELVRAQVEVRRSRLSYATAVEVLEASPDRVAHIWPQAAADGVGGADLGHVALSAQPGWKAEVVAQQLRRIAHLERTVTVETAPGDVERGGLGWRTRLSCHSGDDGRLGMFAPSSRRLVPLSSMPLACPAIERLELFGRRWPAGRRVTAVAPSWSGEAGEEGEPIVVVGDERARVVEQIWLGQRRYRYRLDATGFWQVHRQAPGLLAAAVLNAAGPLDGADVADLYCGAGLFTAPLADAVGPGGRVRAIEGDRAAAADAARNLRGRANTTVVVGDVRQAGQMEGLDVVVLDPPRAGAGRVVIERIGVSRASRVVYVACDPAALARDLVYLAQVGYELTSLRAFDLFPHTHHVECLAVCERAG